MFALGVGVSSSRGSIIRVPWLTQPCRAVGWANDGSTAPHPGPLILHSHLSSWLPFTPHWRAPTFPCRPPVPVCPGQGTHCFLLFFSFSPSLPAGE